MEQSLPPLTLLDIKNHLYAHFLDETTFSLKDDVVKVRLGAVYDDPKGKMAAYKEPLLRAALDDMVKAGLLLVLDQVTGLYMLTQPLTGLNQTVTISPYTASLLADAFNCFAMQTGPVPHVANKFAITGIEVDVVANMVFAFRSELDELYENMEDDAPGDMPFVDPNNN